MNKKQWKYFCAFFVINIIFTFFTLKFFYPIFFESNDDFGISSILAGTYGDEYRQCLIYSNVILGYVLKPLYYLFPVVNWYIVFQYVFVIVSVSVLMKLIAYHKSFLLAFCLNLLSWYIFVFDFIRRIQFTRTAGFVMFAGLICILSYFIHKSYFDCIVGLILFTYGILLRIDCIWLVLPYISLLVLYNAISKKININDIVTFVISVSVLIVFLSIVDKVYYYSNPDWKIKMEYNKVAKQIIDYPIPDYENNKAAYDNVGVSENDILMIKTWSFGDNRFFDIDLFNKINNVKKEVNSRTFSFAKLATKCKGVFFVTFLLLLLVCIGGNNKKVFILGIITGVVTILFISAFFYFGRVVERVIHVVWLSSIIVFMYLILQEYDSDQLSLKVSTKLLYIVTVVVFILSFGVYYIMFFSDLDHDIYYSNDEIVAVEYFSDKPENVYVCNTIDFLNVCSVVEPYKCASPDYLNNTVFTGSWIYNSPLYSAQLEKLGINNIYEDMLIRDNVYYVQSNTKNMDMILTYYKEHFGYICNYDIVDKGYKYNVYKLYIE